MKVCLGMRFVDYQGRTFRITDIYSASRPWDEKRITGIIETDDGRIHIQGRPNEVSPVKIGFVDETGEKRTVITMEQVEIYVKKRLINFE